MNLLLSLALLLGIAVCGCRDTTAHAERIADPAADELRIAPDLISSGQIGIEPVAVGSETVTVRTSGKVGFNEDRLSYVSSPLVGRVVEIDARPGDRVDAGQTLAVIDCPDLGAAASEFIKARADQTLAEHKFQLARDLIALRIMPEKEFRKAQDEVVKAQTEVRRTRERLASLGVSDAELDAPTEAVHVRSRYNVTAPITGTVIDRSFTLGQNVGGDAGQRLYVIADLSTLWVTADIYEKDLRVIRPGEEVRVEAAAWPQHAFDGRIEYVGTTVDPNSRTIKVRVTVDNHDLLLKPEMFVTAIVHTTANAAVLTVPPSAVHGEGAGQPYVFVPLDDGRVVRRPVILGRKWEDRVAIAAGLSANDRVVASGSILLKAATDHQATS